MNHMIYGAQLSRVGSGRSRVRGETMKWKALAFIVVFSNALAATPVTEIAVGDQCYCFEVSS